jgi:hypothetical protein
VGTPICVFQAHARCITVVPSLQRQRVPVAGAIIIGAPGLSGAENLGVQCRHCKIEKMKEYFLGHLRDEVEAAV